MKHTHSRLNRILSILLICVMISQTCFSVYSADLGGAVENGMADTTTAENSSSTESQSGADTAEASEQDKDIKEDTTSEEGSNIENATEDPESSTGEENAETELSEETSETEDPEEIQPEESEFSDDGTADAQSGTAAESTGTEEGSKLVVNEESGLKSMDLSADTEYSGIELADGNTLSINTNGHKLTVTGEITGKGKLILKGANIRVQSISVSDLVFDTATVDASNTDSSETNTNTLVAAESLRIENSEISNAAFLGYDRNVTGDHTLTFGGTGNNLYNIGLAGTYSDAPANVMISGVSLISTTTNTSFCYDNRITYKYQDTELTPGSNWPVSYRSMYSGNTANATVTDYHISGTEETAGSFVQVSEEGVPLPEYAEEGYLYTGWKLDGSEETIKNLPQKLSGDITLQASMTAAELTVTTDLGYEPSADTNDNYENIKKEESQSSTWGAAVTLSTPSRFGYNFTGWKVVKEDGDTQEQTTYKDSYTTLLQDAALTENGSYVIRLKAQWSAKSFPFRLFVKDADVAKMHVTVGEKTYDSVEKFAESNTNITWNSQTSQLELPDIRYGELLSDYLKRIDISKVPVLTDTRDAQSKKDFEGWTTPGGKLLTEDIAFVLGGILDNKSKSVSLTEYEDSIHSTPLFLTSIWKESAYKLTVKNAGSWEVLVNNEVQTLDKNGDVELSVQVGNSVTFRCSAGNPENFSLWNFSDGFLPEETTYSSGAKYISYTAVMPHSDVDAVYKNASDVYIDISKSSITFEENVKLASGRTVDGFWYDTKMEATTFGDNMNVNAMTPAFQAGTSDTEHAEKYFYIWDFKDDFPVTSCNVETKNQLTLVNSMTVTLKNCKLTATEAYKNAAQKRKLNDIVLEGKEASDLQSSLAKSDLRQYGNIIIDVETHDKYTTLIKTEGENAAGVIVQSHFEGSTTYNGTLNVKGTTGKEADKLTVSGTLLNETLNFDSLTLLQDTSVSSDYLLYCSATNEGIGNINFSGCDIKARDKRIHTYRGSLTFKRSGATESSMEIGGVRTYGSSNFYSSTYVRCFGDWIGAYNTLSLSENSSIVIDGNLVPTYSHWTAGVLLNTTGYLIVKGNRADLENLTMLSGTLIANAAVLGRSCTITGGTLIANQIMNSPAKYANVDTDGNYKYEDKGSCEALAEKTQDQQIDDDYPFKTYSQDNAKKGEFLFGGTSRIYLMGYYETSNTRVYDTSITATSDDNPMKAVIENVITEDGNLNTAASLSAEELQAMVKGSRNTQNECVVLGNSTYNTAARMRSVNVSGAEIYAAGNMTFFNDTEITSGTVYCNGRLSGKRDLTIGGTARVTATEVGNNYNLTTTDDSGLTRWQKLTVSGGTITTDRLGVSSKSYGSDGSDSSIVSRSTLLISGNPGIQARTTGKTIEYATDVYLNYLADEKVFTLPADLPKNVHYAGSDYQKLEMDEAVTLQSPTLIADAETKANWVLDSLSGESVDTIDTDAAFSFENAELTDKNAYKERDKICFYAVKGTYDISVAKGKDKIAQIQVGANVCENFDDTIQATRGAEVTVTLNDTSMAGKSVIWYQDATGKFYNVDPKETTQNGQTTLTFTMPAASVQIYVTDEMELYLNRYEISITKDGFRTQYDAETDGKNESSFTYAGNLVITQDNLKGTAFVEEKGSVGVNGILKDQESAAKEPLLGATKNRLHIESVKADRSVTLNKIIMDGGQDEDKIIVEENCGDVELQIDGAVRVLSTYLQTGSRLIWKGKNQKSAGENDQDILQFDSGTSSTANVTGFIHNGTKGQTENVTFDHLNILRSNEYYAHGGSTRRPLVYSPSQKTSAVVTFKDCNMTATVESSMTLVSNYPEVLIENCDFDITATTGWNSVFLNNCSKVTIKDGSFSYTCGASYDAFPLYYSVKDFCIDGAEVSLNNINSGKDTCRMLQPDNMIPDAFTVKNAGELKVDHRIKLKKLTLSSDGDAVPKVYVGENKADAYDGSLLCKDITVEKGEIHTGRILLSGYYNAPGTNEDYQSKTEILAQLRAENNLTKDGTLVLKDGTIEAAEEIGGALGGTITVEGGQITSPKMGSCDKIYGYGKYIPTAEENEWIYSISRIPDAFTFYVSGGTVNVPSDGYLGGMNTSVTIAGGKVNLCENAILGMTEDQKKQLSDYYSSRGEDIADHTDTNCLVTVSGGSVEKEEGDTASGSIHVPYGSVKISGKDTKIKVSNIQSEYGSIEIKEAQSGYGNPYSGGENGQYKKDTIGIWVTNTLSAQTVAISEGAQVYAVNAYAEISGGNGSLSVKKAALYSKAYGEKGISRADSDKKYDDKTNTADQTVFGTRLVSVTYVLNPQDVIFDDDLSTVVNASPTSYAVTPSDLQTPLVNAECKGYNFLGWYTDPQCSGSKTEKLNTTNANDVTLYAKWEKIKVTFRVMMDAKSTANYNETEFENNKNWTAGDNCYVSSKTVTLSYGDRILTTEGINPIDYTTNTLGITELEIQENGYSGSTNINAETLVSKELAEFYKTKAKNDQNAVLILHVKNIQKRIATVTFSVNKKNGKPVDAAFDNGDTQISANVSVNKKIGEVEGFGDASVKVGKSEGLVKPKATGYTFIGWNTDKTATNGTEDGWVTAETVFKKDTTVYAIWHANTYQIEFNAGEGSWVTSDENAPATGAPEVKKLTYYWVYDTPVSENHSFWLKDGSTDQYMKELPYAWREGYVFDHNNGWTYSYEDEAGQTVKEVVTSAEELSIRAVKALDTGADDENGDPVKTALTITASYTPVTVTYHCNEGKWTSGNSEDKETPAYGEALAGYVKATESSQDDGENSDETTSAFRKLAEMTGENGSGYYVADTTSAYFSKNSNYVADDYRNTLTRKGYTFYGWYESQDDADAAISESGNVTSVGTAPRFSNVELYAAWKPNSYKLQIKNKDTAKEYSYTTFGAPDSTGAADSDTAESEKIQVTTGQEIDVKNWPSRDSANAWYVKDKDDNTDTTKRYFLGATFTALDPGAKNGDEKGLAIYDEYVEILSRLEDEKILYRNKADNLEGTVFKLPDNNSYSSDSVPDYPEDSEITMYALYREQSIVFVERYVDKNGVVQEKIQHTADWSRWSDYPYKSYSASGFGFDGYTLVGWYVNTTDADANSRYPEDEATYLKNLEDYKNTAVTNGTYDIMVYTVYAPEIKRNVRFDAQSDPTKDNSFANTYTLPGSMQKGTLSMTISDMPDGLHLISKSEMQKHAYDSIWKEGGKTYTSDTAVAIEITVTGKGNASEKKDLSALSNGKLDFDEIEIGAEDQITLTLYHSRVMTKKISYSFGLNVGFIKTDSNGKNTLENQKISNNITVNLTPSVYTVNYDLKLPEALDKLTILETDGKEDWGDFDKPESDLQSVTEIKKTVKAGYGSALLMNFPKLEGYKQAEGWQVAEDTDADSTRYQNLTVKVSEANKGVIDLSSGYTVQTYKLSADANVLANWKIFYSDGPDSTATEKQLSADSSENPATVKYHSAIRFEPKDPSKADPAEFVTLTLGSDSASPTKKLPDYAKAEENENYTFTMPAQDIVGSYVTEETLYLEEGTISITENGYTQTKTDKTVEKTWRGAYKILQNAENDVSNATANTLILANDLSGRNILLGNLNISSGNSIELKAGNSEGSASANVVLTMNAGTKITAKNIQVPSDCKLTVNGADPKGTTEISDTLKLKPDQTDAAVGGTKDKAANGEITLNDLNMDLSMPAGSVASGIGPISRDTEGTGKITLTNCNVTVAEETTTEVYQGVWVGGNNVPEVTLNQVSMNAGDTTKHMAGPSITAGKTVNIKNGKIGTEEQNVTDPVYAVETLNIDDSEIYMDIQDNISTQKVKVPIGTLNSNGQTKISESIIKVVKAGNGAFSDIYSGIMKIVDADSNVLIGGTQIIEISNGPMNLNGTVYTQNKKTHEADASRKNYRLLEEGAVPSEAPDLTVTAIPENGHVEIEQPLSDGRTAVGIGKLEIHQDTHFILNGNLEVNGSAVLKTSTGIFGNTTSPVTVNVIVKENTSADDSTYGIAFKKSDADAAVFKGTKGSTYVQNGGTLASTSDFGDGSLNVTLNNVVAEVPNLYADTLNIYGGSVTATATESKVGSMPAENGVSTVTIKNASVTAAVIGALGEYDKTFTTVNTENATFNGKLVQDHYRLEYDTGKATGLKTDSLKHTVRTETERTADSAEPIVSVYPTSGNGIPGAPTETDSKLFGCWYINSKDGSKQALADETAKLPAGLKARTTLNGSTLDTVKENDVTDNENADGTKVLTVHAWLNATGTVTIKEGRVFQNFDDKSTEIAVQSNGAWTAQLVSTGTFIEDRDYQVSFGAPLPKGSTLTLTEPATENTAGKYYWYKVDADNISSVKFTDFTAMGETDKFKSVTQTENIPENETFLLSVDFPKASESTVDSQKVTFKLLPSEAEIEAGKEAVSMGEVTYTLTLASQGKVSVSGQDTQTVTVDQLPQNADQLTGKKLFMKAVIRSTDSAENSTASKAVPYNATAKWNGIDGTWISRDTVLFEIGQYGSVTSNPSGEYSFTGLKNGTYQISWSLVYGETATGNIAGNTVSNEAASEYTEAHTDPSLKVTTNAASRVIPAGTETAFTFECETASANVIVTVKKQDNLCTFSKVVIADPDSTVKVDTTTNNQAKVIFGEKADPGTYRICFSTDTNSTNDNVYFTFIIK